MYRALPVSRQVLRPPAGFARVTKQRVARSFASTPVVADGAASASSSTPPPKKRGFFRTLTIYSTSLVVLFYAISPVVAFNNERYSAFFYESVPFGESILTYAEENGLEKKLKFNVPNFDFGKEQMQKIQDSLAKSRNQPASTAPEKSKETMRQRVVHAKDTVAKKVEESKDRVRQEKEHLENVIENLKTKTERNVGEAASAMSNLAVFATKKVEDIVRPDTFSEGVEELVRKVEDALSGKPREQPPGATATPAAAPSGLKPKPTENILPSSKETNLAKDVYPDLPIGFEPPPGFSKPKGLEPTPALSTSSSKAEESKAATLLLVAPAVAELGTSEPIIAELATTIDSLAAFLKDNPTAASAAQGLLDTAKTDLEQLAARIEQARREEHDILEAKMEEQAREYMLRLLETELSAQDKLDEQEADFKVFFEEDRRKIARAYREKLENELKAQSEIINERLKAEVIAQGIELQRRWIREVKVHVEEERGGRLSRLDELATQLKELERVSLDNAAYLDENLRVHAMWAALRVLSAVAIDSSERRPFRDELRVLRHISTVREDELVSAVLDAIEQTDVPDIGVEPLADLTTWFTTSVAPQVARVALVPEYDAGVLSYFASYLISSFRFQRHGLVEGNDVLSVLARAQYYLNEKNLDSATRELNQLKGAPRALLADWLDAARRRLEVLQAIEAVQTRATQASLLLV